MLDGIGRVVIPLNGFLSSNPDSQDQTSIWANNNVKLCSAYDGPQTNYMQQNRLLASYIL